MNKNGKDNNNNNNNNNFELTHLLNRRRVIMDTKKTDTELHKTYKLVNLFREFHEFSRKQIKEYEITFNTYDTSGNGLLELNELKYIMEKVGAPQTHLVLKKLVAEVAKDNDSKKISFPQFLTIYRNVKACELLENAAESDDLAETPLPHQIDVVEVGVIGAKNFFETKIKQQFNNRSNRNQELGEHNRRYKNEEPGKRHLQFHKD